MAAKQQDRSHARAVQVVGGALETWGEKAEWTPEERYALVERVQAGDKTALSELRAMFAAHPEAALALWSPTRTQRYDLGRRMGGYGDDLLLPEIVTAQAEAMQRELEGEHPSALERILCERVVTAQTILSYLETCAPSVSASALSAQATRHDEMVTRAHTRLMQATLTLAKVRRLLRPSVQVNIATAGAQQLNMAPETPLLPGAGE